MRLQGTLLFAVVLMLLLNTKTIFSQVIDESSISVSIGRAIQLTEKDPDTDEDKVLGCQLKITYKNLTGFGIKVDAVVHVYDIPERNDVFSGLAYLLSNSRDAGGQGKIAYKGDKIRLKPYESLTRTYFFEIKWMPNNRQTSISFSDFERSQILERIR